MKRNAVLAFAAIGLLVIWAVLMFDEISGVTSAEDGIEVIRSDLRIWVVTLLTGLLGSTLAVLTAADPEDADGRLGALPQVMGVKGPRLPGLMAAAYALIYIAGVLVGLIVVLLNEPESSALLLAVSSGGLGTLATGVAAWMGVTFQAPATNGD